MDLLHRITDHLAIRRKQAAIRDALARLSGRALADLGLEPGEIAAVARLGARLGPEGGTLGEVVARVRAARSETVSVADRLFGALERMSARKAETLTYTPYDLDRYREEAYRLRAETSAAFWRSLGQGLVALFRPVKQAALDSGLGRRIRLELFWRRAYRRVRAELASYTDRELNSDLRLARSEIDDIAAEGADERVAAYVAANPNFRRAWSGRGSMHRAHG
jgi:uncharacterized protein YjiS (DUF1127 family)